MNFEAGNETREKTWRDFIAEQNEEWSEKRVVFCSNRWILESETLRCEKNSVNEQNFLFACGNLKQLFLIFGQEVWLLSLFELEAGFGSGLKVSGNSFEFYSDSEVFHVFLLTIVLFYCLKWVLKQFSDKNWLQFCGF